jgi:beta-lactamase regulating signal transducer with metallopeptidase domain
VVSDPAILGQVAAWSAWVPPSGVPAACYLAGASFFLLRFVSGLLLVRRLRRQSAPVEGLPAVRLRQVVGAAAALVRTHRRVQVPVAAGLRRPFVLLPETWLTWETDRLAAVLGHELAHVARRDYGWNVLAAVFQTIFWFSPFAWFVVGRIRLTAELAADRFASDELGRVSYARILVESAREMLRGRALGVLAPGAATALEARVEALTTLPDGAPSAGRSVRRLAIVLVSIAILASAFVQIGGETASGGSAPTASDGHAALHQIRHSGR